MNRSSILSYSQISGQMIVSNVTFANFDFFCGRSQDVIISSNPYNDDAQHPVVFENINLFNVSEDSKVFLFPPNLDKINRNDCGDMDCDGLKKNLLTDLDGSFLGDPGTITSISEYGWGEPDRGVGDFRIPYEMQMAPNGSWIDPATIYDTPGIVRDNNLCYYRSTSQGLILDF